MASAAALCGGAGRPSVQISYTDRADPSWADSIAATASPRGGTAAARGARLVMAGPGRRQ